MMNSPEDEGTPMTGPLPLELAQIRDNNEREAAAMAARRRSEDIRPGGEICIKLRRSCITHFTSLGRPKTTNNMSTPYLPFSHEGSQF